MIESISVTNSNNETLVLPLSNPYESGLAVKSVTGLGGEKADINTTDIATIDGSIYNSARTTERDISISLLPIYTDEITIDEARRRAYRYFPLKGKVRFTVTIDGISYYTYGYVEKNSPSIFAKQETINISLLCPDPNFYLANGGVISIFAGTYPKFEFPFDNNSVSEKLIEFGLTVFRQYNNVFYSGNVNIGFTINIHATGKVTGFSIYNLKTRGAISIDDAILTKLTGSGIVAGDTIIISTIKGNKKVILFRNGVETNIINAVGKNPTWFELVPGDNEFGYTCTDGASDLEFKIESLTAYQGV